jgi:hypothetical protein
LTAEQAKELNAVAAQAAGIVLWQVWPSAEREKALGELQGAEVAP